MVIGVYGVSSQSGRAYFVDFIDKGYRVIGYCRSSAHGKAVVDDINRLGGCYLKRPENSNNELSHFVPLEENELTLDIELFVEKADVIILAIPSNCHVEVVKILKEHGLDEKKTPIILSPSRTFASPYLWKVLGDGYPIACFSTCPYSCKTPDNETSLIKRRKRTWVISLEGKFLERQKEFLKAIFPQAAFSLIPASTSLNNIGAIFHCATYLYNFEAIEEAKREGGEFSFYMDGIAKRPEIGELLEEIDQVRLDIANELGLSVFGLKNNPREDVWRKLTNGLRALEAEHESDIEILRKIRGMFTEYLNNSIISAQHWLDITYGVVRIEGEALSSAIGRTPTYQKNSVPQERYMSEDIPTGLVAFEAIAQKMGVECSVITKVINKYSSMFNDDIRERGRNLKEFSTDYIIRYLRGEVV